MALAKTTLAGAMAAGDTEVLLTSITGVTVGTKIAVDGERMQALYVGASASVPVGVIRGISGTAAVAHPVNANAYVGASSDFSPPARVGATAKNEITSYSANGAIALPRPGTNRIAMINGTTALTGLTVAAPTKENDGDLLIIVANGKAAHVVTVVSTVGVGGGGSALDALTFAAGGQNCVVLMAANEAWVPFGSVYAGTLTNITVTAA